MMWSDSFDSCFGVSVLRPECSAAVPADSPGVGCSPIGSMSPSSLLVLDSLASCGRKVVTFESSFWLGCAACIHLVGLRRSLARIVRPEEMGPGGTPRPHQKRVPLTHALADETTGEPICRRLFRQILKSLRRCTDERRTGVHHAVQDPVVDQPAIVALAVALA